MSLQPLYRKFEIWQTSLRQQCETLLHQSRNQLVAVQQQPEADERIARIEEILRAKLEPILLEREDELRPFQQEADRYFEQQENPSDADYQVKEKIDSGTGLVRDWLDRKIASQVAQARAQELAGTAPGVAQPGRPNPAADPRTAPAQQFPKFCVACGTPLQPSDFLARRCPTCGSAVQA